MPGAGLSLNMGCWQNLLAEKEVIAGLILAVNYNKHFLGYCYILTIMRYWNQVELSTLHVNIK